VFGIPNKWFSVPCGKNLEKRVIVLFAKFIGIVSCFGLSCRVTLYYILKRGQWRRSFILSLLTFGAAALMMRPLNGQSVAFDTTIELAIAANNATLWGSKYSTTFGDTGQLWAWVINPSSGALTPLFSPTISSNNAANCTGHLPTLPSSYVPASFAEPTLVNGKVYVPAFESLSSGTTILTGGGVLVFGTCQ
jgi:hypothetical protein